MRCKDFKKDWDSSLQEGMKGIKIAPLKFVGKLHYISSAAFDNVSSCFPALLVESKVSYPLNSGSKSHRDNVDNSNRRLGDIETFT